MTAESHVPFTEDPPRADAEPHPTDALLLQLDNFEGPIDVLLQLARDQKVDLTQISILQLARQYLSFIDRAQVLSLDLAAEYLVMAAWLAYLKSRLLLPKTEEAGDEPSADMIAEALSYQLRRLEGIQHGAQKLGQRMRMFLTVYPRGMREKFQAPEPDKYNVDLYQLLKAYGDITQRKTSSKYELVAYDVMSMEDAMGRLTKMLGNLPRNDASSIWTTLSSFLPEKTGTQLYARSSLASILTASLELAKQGKLELRQEGLFRPIYLRAVDRAPLEPQDSPHDPVN
jgi:segregation and condensation protein A